MRRVDYSAHEVGFCPPYVEQWVGTADFERLNLGISNAVLRAVSNKAGNVELSDMGKVEDARLCALVEAVNAERIAGFPSGRLFLDSVEQALAAALVKTVQCLPAPTYRGGLGAARLRTLKELVHARLEAELTLVEMAQSVELSTAHFARMFRESTGETPHQFVLRQRVERAKEVLRSPNGRIIDIAVACGFKTQEHFAQVFRKICGVSPTEYRRNC
jgi:AraC family transcriptional regulator